MLLRSELKVIYETDDISAKNNARELIQFLKDKKLEDLTPKCRNCVTLKHIKNVVP